jgi:hypothetical protein
VPDAIADVLTASGVAAVRCQAPRAGRSPGSPNPPALTVLTGFQPPEAGDRLRRAKLPHLAVSAAEAIGIVGPLVRPGTTACLRCLDLARAERDPAWPLILAQLAGRVPEPAACDAALTAAVAAQAAAQVLQYVDEPAAAGPCESATLELVQPGWQWRRRPWPPHDACTCRARTAA